MKTAFTDASASISPEKLEAAILAIESRLEAMGTALQRRDVAQVEQCAGELHRALTEAVQMSTQAARRQGLEPALRERLARASGQVAAQREALARASAALDRAIDVLIPPRNPPVVYSDPSGRTQQPGSAAPRSTGTSLSG
ncbi:hypothetical protein [Caldimonas tepidiphila]|uniref:hypothetical protein n=1 Tax=Caldimonas tepidiphila TaxID=2315841 RepID=UPI001300AE1A|nr:hypothetical protein [Caldimonas tepidiphila]